MSNKDIVNKIIDYESGSMNEYEVIEFFKELVDSGLVWSLQGSYGRTAQNLLNEGLIHNNSGAKKSMKVITNGNN